jgi:hypothetical protein
MRSDTGVNTSGLIDFTDRDLRFITDAVPHDANQKRIELLPDIIRDWSRTDLPRLFWHTPEPVEARKEHYRRLNQVETAATHLNTALAGLNESERLDIITKIACPPDRFPRGLTASNLARATDNLEAMHAFVRELRAAAKAASVSYPPKRGPARNNVPYVVLLDLAEIFEWLAGIAATRRVDPITGEDDGPFYRFAAAIWPVVFGSDSGLSSALKNWATSRKKYSERSPVLCNVQLRHPEWEIFLR